MGLPALAAVPREVPCLALRGAVVFPGSVAPLLVGRPKSRRAVRRARSGDGEILLLAQRERGCDDPSPADLYEVGTLARIRSVSEGAGGVWHVGIEGYARARVSAWSQLDHVLVSTVEPLTEASDADEALLRVLSKWARRLKLAVPPAEPGSLCDHIASTALENPGDRQQVLEATSLRDRIERLQRLLLRQGKRQEVQGLIEARARHQIERAQREFFLQEQLKAIQEELGEGSETREVRALVRDRQLPEPVVRRVERELRHLDRLPALSPEAGVVRTYLDWLLALPWGQRAPEQGDLAAARAALDADHEGLDQVKERVLEHLAMRRLVERFQGPILCLVGPPGTGKTSIVRSIAAALGRPLARASLGGLRDEAEIRGHRRTYVGAQPGRIMRGMCQAGVLNPVFLLDEIDKVGADPHGDPAAALLEALDAGQNTRFSDHYLELPFDLSEALFVTTANTLDGLPRPLLDRLEIVPVPGYSEEEKLRIARGHLLPRQSAVHGLAAGEPRVSQAALRDIIREYTREAGVRGLERTIAALCRKAARLQVERPGTRAAVTRASLRRLLGRPLRPVAGVAGCGVAGVATGLGWTEAGGEVLVIEVASMPGRGRLSLTGRLGEVMRESAEAALSYVRANARALGIPEGFHERLDLHVHVPEGAIPKDGPSAGLPIAVAMISALTGAALRPGVALTGEVTLLGRVLPVGAIKEKVLAARRGGMRAVVLPVANRADWGDLPAGVRRELRPLFVTTLPQALDAALGLSQPAVLAYGAEA